FLINHPFRWATTSLTQGDTWLPLLDPLNKLGYQIEIVTTNYDLVIEEAISKGNIVDNGWVGNSVRTLDMERWTDSKNTEKTGLLTKLHGSLNWTWGSEENQIYIGAPAFSGNHNSHVIIYPGFKGKPSETIFQNFHSHFRKSLESSHAVIFIGFAFRDEYINDICERYITQNTITSVINPAIVDLPFNSKNTNYISEPFNKESVAAVNKFIRENLPSGIVA
ncbi:MAG: SIR2 family protein, partial [Methylobacter sp.]